VKTDAPWPGLVQARVRVLGMQAKLHRWSNGDATARFDDLFNLVVDPAFLVMAWERVAHNAGARSAGVDGLTARAIEAESVPDFLAGPAGAGQVGTVRTVTGQGEVDPEVAGLVPAVGDPHYR